MWIEFADSELEELLASTGALLRMEPMSSLHIGRGPGPEARARAETRSGPEKLQPWHRAPVAMNRGDVTAMRRIESPI